MTFNPFEFILILEECINTPQLYKEKEDLFKNFMECVEKNKNEDNDKFIEIVEKEINKTNGGSSVDAILTKEEVQTNIDGISDDIKTQIEKAINDVNSIVVDDLISFISTSVTKGKTENNIKDLLLLTNYGLKYALDCQTILQDIKEFDDIDNKLTVIIKSINDIIGLATKYDSIPPEKNFDGSILKLTIEYHEKTNNILSQILKTTHTALNSIAGKVIMASSIIFATMKCLSISTAENDVETNTIIKKILVDDINIINGTDPTPTSGIDSDIIKLINDTISILKKKCKPDHMMDTFIYVLNMIERK
jgi:hypothetical protein